MDVQADRSPSLREVMGAYPTGVTVVGGSDADGVPFGLTVNSFTSVSLDPPLVLVCIGHGSTWHDELAKAQCFAVSVLAADQQQTAVRFAQEPSEGRFDDVPWTRGENGSPILEGVVAWMECAVRTVIDGGDHSILIGQIDRSGVSDRPALLFHRGRLGSSPGRLIVVDERVDPSGGRSDDASGGRSDDASGGRSDDASGGRSDVSGGRSEVSGGRSGVSET